MSALRDPALPYAHRALLAYLLNNLVALDALERRDVAHLRTRVVVSSNVKNSPHDSHGEPARYLARPLTPQASRSFKMVLRSAAWLMAGTPAGACSITSGSHGSAAGFMLSQPGAEGVATATRVALDGFFVACTRELGGAPRA